MSSTTASAARTSTSVAGWTLLSRLSGMTRLVVTGALLGPTYLGNIYLGANSVPNLVFSTIAGPVLGMIVVPAVVRNWGVARSSELVGRLTAMLLVASAIVAAGLVLLSPVIAWALTFGIADPALRAAGQHAAILILVLVAPQVVLYTIAALAEAVQQARGSFAFPAGIPVVENIGLITCVVVAVSIVPAGTEVGLSNDLVLIVLGGGSTVAALLHAGLQVAGACRMGMPMRPRSPFGGDAEAAAAREIARRIARSAGVAAFPCLAYFALLTMFATVSGGVIVLQLAYAVYVAPWALGASAIGRALLPRLSNAAGRADAMGFASALRMAISYCLIASLPALVLMVVFAEPIARTLANGRLSEHELVSALAACIAVLGVSQLGESMVEISRRALFAQLDVRGPVLGGIITLVVTLVAGAFPLLFLSGPARFVGLSAVILAADAVTASVLLLRVRSSVRPEPLVDRKDVLEIAVALVALLPPAALGWWLAGRIEGRLGVVGAGVCGLVALVAFGLALRALRGRRTSRTV